MINILIAEDDKFARDSLKYIIEQDDELNVVAVASNGKEAFIECEKHLPDVVLMDLNMPQYDGIEGIKLIRQKFKAVKIVIITSDTDDDIVKKVFSYQLDGYICKDINPLDIKMIIKNTVKNLLVIHSKAFAVLQNCIKEFSKDTNEKIKNNCKVFLSSREMKIIKLIVEGKNNKEIAKNICLTEGRVRNIISDILKRLYLKDRTQLALYAIKNKLADINSFVADKEVSEK
ncbi:MAG: response regulator transcription factor [Bacillota bacterium]|nr:response regulator transcription factor [Bacillota bacterium]